MADNKNNIAGKPELAGEDDQTVKVPRANLQASKGPRVSLTSPGKDAVKPSDETSISPAQVGGGKAKGRKTIKLKPITGDGAKDDGAEETISMPKPDMKAEAKKAMPTLKRATKEPMQGNLDDESTVRIQKPKMSKPAHPIPDVTAQPAGSKQTVKLRPPAAKAPKAEAPKPAAAAASKKTIKLSAPAPAPASAPAPKPSAPTVKMNSTQTNSGKKGLTFKKSAPAAAPPQAASEPAPPVGGGRTTSSSSPVSTNDAAANPGPILTILAVVATLCLVYYVWAVTGQFFEQYQEVETANVPGLSGAVLPPN